MRDNLNALCTGNFSAKGDLFAATGANAGQRVPVGANVGNPLVANSACTAGVAFDATIRISGSTLYLRGGTNQSTASPVVRIMNNKIISWDDSASAATCGMFIWGDSNNALSFGTNDSTRVSISKGGQLLVGTTTCNANMTQGLTIHQGANTDEILTLKNNATAHGVTSDTETDTFGFIAPFHSVAGGLRINGYNDGGSVNIAGLVLFGVIAAADDTTRATTSKAPIHIRAAHKSGTSSSGLNVNSNMVVIEDATAGTRFIFDSDGDLSADAAVTASAYDAHDDALLCRAISLHISQPDTIIRNKFDEWTNQYDKEFLARAKLAWINDDGSRFVNLMQLSRLHNSAIWQQETKIRRIAERLERLAQAVGVDTKLLEDPPTDTEPQMWLSPPQDDS